MKRYALTVSDAELDAIIKSLIAEGMNTYNNLNNLVGDEWQSEVERTNLICREIRQTLETFLFELFLEIDTDEDDGRKIVLFGRELGTDLTKDCKMFVRDIVDNDFLLEISYDQKFCITNYWDIDAIIEHGRYSTLGNVRAAIHELKQAIERGDEAFVFPTEKETKI